MSLNKVGFDEEKYSIEQSHRADLERGMEPADADELKALKLLELDKPDELTDSEIQRLQDLTRKSFALTGDDWDELMQKTAEVVREAEAAEKRHRDFCKGAKQYRSI